MKYLVRILKLIRFTGFYLKELLLANLKVAYDVLAPTPKMRPGILEIPLDVKTDAEILTFSNLITMTPGSISFALSEDKSKLYVHAMYVEDVEKFKKEIKTNFENYLLGVFR